jgi:hypothetical protein
MIVLAVHTGLRCGNLLSLRWDHIDSVTNNIRLSRPVHCAKAPVKAPLSRPNTSLANNPVGIAAQLTFTMAR